MKISFVVAHGKRREVGYKGELPWHMRSDLLRFKKITWGAPIVMGRKTFESLKKPLAGRVNVVISKTMKATPGVLVFSRLTEAVTWAREKNYTECFIIGGGQIFDVAWELAHKLYVTEVDYVGPADTYFPPYAHLPWKKTKEEFVAQKKGDDFSSTFTIWERA